MKVLLIDLETAPNVAYVWGLFKENIPVARLISSGYTMCFSAKWLGEDELFFHSVQNTGRKEMLSIAYNLLNEADVVVHYNGTYFDVPTLNKEFIKEGFTPPSPYKQVDLLKTVREKFKFPSNKLEYVADALDLGQKYKHKGFELWTECMAGDPQSWAEMEEYNKQDVILLENLYIKLLPWISNHPNTAMYRSVGEHQCPNCGSTNLVKRGYARTLVSVYERFRCNNCGKWSRKRQAEKGQPLINTVEVK